VSPEAKLSPDEISRLIFLPGFSTRQQVTETSGRGVGLDAVVQALSTLQGNVTVTSVWGSGTEFRLFALATVGTVHALHVEANGEHFLIPSIQLVRADAAGGVINTQEAALPDTWLPSLLHGKSTHAPANPEDRPGLVIDVDGTLRRISVNRVVEAREFLISPPPQLIDRLPGISGVTTLADGSLGIVLDLIDLSRKPLPVQRAGLREMQAAVQNQLHVLVVDDSASVRNTIGALLRDENYKVTLARDGLAAMQAIIDTRFDLVLTDLEMPQLNGFELTEYIRNRSEQRAVPVIMLTSRGQEKHRVRGQKVGVNAFLVKPYADQHLLETIRGQLGQVKTGHVPTGVTPNVDRLDRPDHRENHRMVEGVLT
jgi:CheY-like chemotaxis protein